MNILIKSVFVIAIILLCNFKIEQNVTLVFNSPDGFSEKDFAVINGDFERPIWALGSKNALVDFNDFKNPVVHCSSLNFSNETTFSVGSSVEINSVIFSHDTISVGEHVRFKTNSKPIYLNNTDGELTLVSIGNEQNVLSTCRDEIMMQHA